MVGEATSPITEGPHKLGPAAITDGLHKSASVAPSETQLPVTEVAPSSRPETPPPAGTESDDAGTSDADSGTADVLDDLPPPDTPEPDTEQAEDGRRQEDQHRVVISVTETASEVRAQS